MLIKASDDMVFNFNCVSKIFEEDNWIKFYSQNSVGCFFQLDNMTIDEFLKLYLEAKKNNELFLDLTMPESKPISLEVGKTYITRTGKEILITEFSPVTSYPFGGKTSIDLATFYYTLKGEYLLGEETDFDIIGEKSA